MGPSTEKPKHPKRRRWKLAAFAIGVVLLYVPMIGPILWIDERYPLPDDYWLIYRPILNAAVSGPEPVANAIRWYEGLWTENHRRLIWQENIDAMEDFMGVQEADRRAALSKHRSQ